MADTKECPNNNQCNGCCPPCCCPKLLKFKIIGCTVIVINDNAACQNNRPSV